MLVYASLDMAAGWGQLHQGQSFALVTVILYLLSLFYSLFCIFFIFFIEILTVNLTSGTRAVVMGSTLTIVPGALCGCLWVHRRGAWGGEGCERMLALCSRVHDLTNLRPRSYIENAGSAHTCERIMHGKRQTTKKNTDMALLPVRNRPARRLIKSSISFFCRCLWFLLRPSLPDLR